MRISRPPGIRRAKRKRGVHGCPAGLDAPSLAAHLLAVHAQGLGEGGPGEAALVSFSRWRRSKKSSGNAPLSRGSMRPLTVIRSERPSKRGSLLQVVTCYLQCEKLVKVVYAEGLEHPAVDAYRGRTPLVDQHGDVAGAEPEHPGKPVLGAVQQGQPLPEGRRVEPDDGPSPAPPGASYAVDMLREHGLSSPIGKGT